MSDKEKLEKENEQFSSAILYVATAVYVGVCAMVFGALYAKLPSVGETFLKLMESYGNILAGIPVLVAAVVAKQQLDAMRRQHVATIKRSFQKELDSLREISVFASEAGDSSIQSASKNALNQGLEGLVIDCPDKKQLKTYRSVVPFQIAELAARISLDTYALYEDSIEDQPNLEIIELRLDEIKTNSRVLLSLVDDRLKTIAEYWS